MLELTFYLKFLKNFFLVLKKASKFSVVFDETEEEVENLKKNELTESVEPEKENPEDDFEDMVKKFILKKLFKKNNLLKTNF